MSWVRNSGYHFQSRSTDVHEPQTGVYSGYFPLCLVWSRVMKNRVRPFLIIDPTQPNKMVRYRFIFEGTRFLSGQGHCPKMATLLSTLFFSVSM